MKNSGRDGEAPGALVRLRRLLYDFSKDVAMKRTLALLLPIALLLITAHRLPAPISEVPATTPTPKPKPEGALRSKPKPEATAKPKSRTLSFPGTWAGTGFGKNSDGTTYSLSYIIKISDDEKTALVSIAEVGKIMGPTQFSCARFREALTWSMSNSGGTIVYTMRIKSNGTVDLLREGRFTGGDFDGTTYTETGTLSRQDASSAPSAPQTTIAPAPQTTATAAPKTPLASQLPSPFRTSQDLFTIRLIRTHGSFST